MKFTDFNILLDIDYWQDDEGNPCTSSLNTQFGGCNLLSGEELASNFGQRIVQAKSEKQRHEWVALLSSFSLQYVMPCSVFIKPCVLCGRRVGQAHEW